MSDHAASTEPGTSRAGFYRIVDVARRDKPGRRQWLAIVKRESLFLDWRGHRDFYGRTREVAVAKAQRWADKSNAEIWVSEPADDDRS